MIDLSGTMSRGKSVMDKIPVDSSNMPYRVTVAGVLVECETPDEAVALARLVDNDSAVELRAGSEQHAFSPLPRRRGASGLQQSPARVAAQATPFIESTHY
jgi:hypothetical protein